MSMARDKWDDRFIELAHLISTWSKDPSTQVGAVIARPDKSIASLGFNGFPRGLSDDPALYADKETKYARVIHAEMNAVLSANEPVRGYALYVTHPPCDRCMAHIIQAGIAQVMWPRYVGLSFQERWADSTRKSISMLAEAGVQWDGWDPDE